MSYYNNSTNLDNRMSTSSDNKMIVEMEHADTNSLLQQPSSSSSQTNTKQEPKPTFREKVKVLSEAFLPLIITLVVDAGIPVALYYILKNYVSTLVALIISGIPPLLHVLYTFIKKRKIDILGCIFVVSFIVSAILSVVTGDVRATLLRDSAVTALVSVMFFVTMIPIRTKWFYNRPIVFMISQQMASAAPKVEWTDVHGEKHSMDRMEWCWEYSLTYRRYCYIINGGWAVFLMGEFIAKVVMIEATSLDVDHIVLYGNIIIASVTVTMTLVSIIGGHRIRKRIIADAKLWHEQNDYSDKLPK